ncbi:MAG: hypothetical protein C4531_12230 [Desulfurivibrio sp.]|nr:MAG: hypothetical protein C4531_12230 [Desulfurivibrio sp.]
MGKLSRLRLRQPSKDPENQEGVGAAELAVLSGGGEFPGHEKNGAAQEVGNGTPPAPPVCRDKRKAGR